MMLLHHSSMVGRNSLRQCESHGYVTLQLEYRYDKKLKQQLRDDWEKQLQELKLKVAHGVMEIVLHEREAHTSDAAGRSVAGDDILTPRGVTAQLAE